LTSENVKSCLQGLQASEVAAPPAPKRQKITRKTTQDEAVSSLPSDQEIDTVLRLYEGLMQSINAEQFLAVLAKPSSDEPSASAAPPLGTRELIGMSTQLEESLWNWASLADTVRPRTDGRASHQSDAWCYLGRVLQQRAHVELHTADILNAFRRQLARVSSTVPAKEPDLCHLLYVFFSRLERKPLLVHLVGGIIANRPDQPSLDPRVHHAVHAVLPSFHYLSSKLRRVQNVEEDPEQERRRVLGMPTPQKARQRQDEDAEASASESDAGASVSSMPSSLGRKSSLFKDCFPELGTVASSSRPPSAAPSEDGADIAGGVDVN